MSELKPTSLSTFYAWQSAWCFHPRDQNAVPERVLGEVTCSPGICPCISRLLSKPAPSRGPTAGNTGVCYAVLAKNQPPWCGQLKVHQSCRVSPVQLGCLKLQLPCAFIFAWTISTSQSVLEKNPVDLKTGPAGRTLFQVSPGGSPAEGQQALSE